VAVEPDAAATTKTPNHQERHGLAAVVVSCPRDFVVKAIQPSKERTMQFPTFCLSGKIALVTGAIPGTRSRQTISTDG
jgi:hypothetical protein